MRLEIELGRDMIRLPSQQLQFQFDTDDRRFFLRFIALVAERTAVGTGRETARPYMAIADVMETLSRWNEDRYRRYPNDESLLRGVYRTVTQRMRSHGREQCFTLLDADGQTLPPKQERVLPCFIEHRRGPKRAEYRLEASYEVKEVLWPADASQEPDKAASDSSVHLDWTLKKEARDVVCRLLSEYPRADEVIFVAYFGKMLAEALRTIDTDWWIGELRLLFRDLEVIDPTCDGEVPNEAEQLAQRQGQQAFAMNDLRGFLGSNIGRIVVRYYRSQPCLRGFLLKAEGDDNFTVGALSLYRQRIPKSSLDFSARQSPVMPLSVEHPLTGAMLENVKAWFDCAWEHGSYSRE